jgi:hypothetical protein
MQPLTDALVGHRVHHKPQAAMLATDGIDSPPHTREAEHHRPELDSDTGNIQCSADGIR